MSKEKGRETTSHSSEHQAKSDSTATLSSAQEGEQQQQSSIPGNPQSQAISHQFASLPPALTAETEPHNVEGGDKKSPAGKTSETASQSTDEAANRPRQVIAVSASKGPAAFFNLARKFLVTDEMCDLSALEGAIVSAVDAAHLLERSKLANIVRIQTSYVSVEPKRRKQAPPSQGPATSFGSGLSTASAMEGIQVYHGGAGTPGSPMESQTRRTSSGRELRRARIVITVRRTESYKKWLEENPLQAIIAGDTEDDAAVDAQDESEP